MSAQVFDLTTEAAKRKFGFEPESAKREAASRDLRSWLSKYKDLGINVMEQQIGDLLQEIDMLRYDR